MRSQVSRIIQANSVQRLRRFSTWLVVGVLWLVFTAPVAANGVPVEIFLDHLPFKTTWEAAAGARGMAVVSANDEAVRVMAQNLPTPPAGQVYYAWLEQAAGGFLAIGELAYMNDGTASVDQHMPELPHSEHFSWVLVSLEDIRFVGNAPSIDIALAGRLPNAMALPPSGTEAPALLPVTGSESTLPTWIGLPLIWALAAGLCVGASFVLTRQMEISLQRVKNKGGDGQ